MPHHDCQLVWAFKPIGPLSGIKKTFLAELYKKTVVMTVSDPKRTATFVYSDPNYFIKSSNFIVS